MRDKKYKKILKRYREHPFYKKRGINSINEIPFIDSQEVIDIYKMSNQADSMVFFTSGTTGNPKAIYYGKFDISYMANYIKWFCDIEGANQNDKVLVLMDQSFWGVGYITGLGHIKAGNCVIPVDNDLPKDKIKEIIDIVKPTIISSLPSVLLEVGDVIDGYKFRIIETTGEKLNNKERRVIEQIYGGEVFDAYGLTEAIIGVECKNHDGYHFNSDRLLLEIVDPYNKEARPDEEWGELVVSTIDEYNTPIIRYLSGDLCKVSYKKCSCGLCYPKVWIKDRVRPTINLHEGYKIEKGEIAKLFDRAIGRGIFIDAEAIKNESKILLNLFINDAVDDSQQEKITLEFVNYSYELMHMIRNNKLEFKFIIQ